MIEYTGYFVVSLQIICFVTLFFVTLLLNEIPVSLPTAEYTSNPYNCTTNIEGINSIDVVLLSNRQCNYVSIRGDIGTCRYEQQFSSCCLE